MIKIDLSRNIAERMNIHTKDAESFLTTFTDIVSDSLASGEPVRLSGFGTFDVRLVAAHQPRNPKTGEPVQVPATHYPTFRAGKTLKAKTASFTGADKKPEKRSLQKAEPPAPIKGKSKKSATFTETG
jgi:DNA-binding protein HU-beta